MALFLFLGHYLPGKPAQPFSLDLQLLEQSGIGNCAADLNADAFGQVKVLLSVGLGLGGFQVESPYDLVLGYQGDRKEGAESGLEYRKRRGEAPAKLFGVFGLDQQARSGAHYLLGQRIRQFWATSPGRR